MSFKNADAISRHHGTSYQLQKAFRNGKFDYFVEVRCSKCETVEELRQGQNTDTTDPNLLSKRMKSKGWEFHPYNKRACVCPVCQKENSEMPKPTLVANSDPQVVLAQQTPRTITGEERYKVRHLLDQHFDDKMGAYIDGYSDQRIGTELEIPWKLVFDIREAAYGPIREDPRIAAVRQDMARLERQMSELTKGMTELRSKIAALGAK